jgi:hypothetical protein
MKIKKYGCHCLHDKLSHSFNICQCFRMVMIFSKLLKMNQVNELYMRYELKKPMNMFKQNILSNFMFVGFKGY